MAAPLWQNNLSLNTTSNAERKRFYWNEIGLIDQVGAIVRAWNDVVHKDDPTQRIAYVAAYPDYVFNYTGEEDMRERPSRVICYDVVKKESGSLGKEQFSRKQRHRPYFMQAEPTQVDGRDKVIEQYMKPYDVQLRFDCLGQSDHDSLVLIHDFEKILEAHAMYLETGCMRFIYDGRQPSFFNRDTKYKSRTCLFFAQVQELWQDEEDVIKEITINYAHYLDTGVTNAIPPAGPSGP